MRSKLSKVQNLRRLTRERCDPGALKIKSAQNFVPFLNSAGIKFHKFTNLNTSIFFLLFPNLSAVKFKKTRSIPYFFNLKVF